ncbi:hypothetical protein ACVJBD_007299 [Rhizobium mongolense]
MTVRRGNPARSAADFMTYNNYSPDRSKIRTVS